MTTTMTTYWVLMQRYEKGGKFGEEFGSWDRDEVVAERQAFRDNGVMARDLRIERSGYRKTVTASGRLAAGTPSRYDYDLQCWIVAGKVAKCGHTAIHDTCYACIHAGETADN